MIGSSPCSRDVFAPLLNKLVYVLDSLMAGHYRGITGNFEDRVTTWFRNYSPYLVTTRNIT